MSAGAPTDGLNLEQAPPLAIPTSFFLVAPFAAIAAGLLLLVHGEALLVTRFAGPTAALTHLGTLGFVGAVMLGALYQMIPVVAGAPVPFARAAHGVHVGLVAGVASLVWGLATNGRAAVIVGASVLGVTIVAFLVPVAIALARAPVRSSTVWGMRVAVAGLTAVVALGFASSWVRGSGVPSPALPSWISAHLAIGLVVWIGGLITAVSYQVLPMFYLTPGFPRWLERAIVLSVALSLLALLACVAVSADPFWIAAAALPGALVIWLVHPIASLWLIEKRRRRRVDPSVWFWRLGLCVALATLPVGAAAVLADDARYPVAFGWLALFGWAGLIVHGMLTRILPFLVWFHRFSALVGTAPVPPMRRLLPDSMQRVGLALHATTLLVGCAALLSGVPFLARATGAGLVLTGISLLSSIVRVLAHARPAPAQGSFVTTDRARSA